MQIPSKSRCCPRYAQGSPPIFRKAADKSRHYYLLVNNHLVIFPGNTPLMFALEQWDTEEIVKLLLIDTDINITNRNGETALHIATIKNKLPEMSWLISNGVDVDAKETDGDTALSLSVQCSNHQATKILLSHGANPNIADSIRMTPLHKACRLQENPSKELVSCLISAGGDVEVTDILCKTTSLQVSVRQNNFSAAWLLMQADCNIDDELIPSAECSLKLATLILIAGAKIQNEDNFVHAMVRKLEYSTPLDDEEFNKGIVDLFLSHFVDGPSPLRHLCRRKIRQILRTDITKKLQLLGIPKLLFNYLLLKEFDNL